MVAKPIVDIKSGKIHGYSEGNIQIFKGIPYAEPPVGDLRFKPSVPKKTWKNTLDCTQFGPIAPQRTDAFLGALKDSPQSEADCLNLNVWTPGTDDKNRPVLFWIHGGGFSFGSGSSTDGSVMADKCDVVVVSINYRVGILGFLYIENEISNLGMLDQITALNWVRENIANFGGDPNNVTIFGESAGAVAVSALLAMPSAKGLFHRAIVQSGTAHPLRHQASLGIAGAEKVLTELEVTGDTIKGLKDIPTKEIVAVASKLEVESRKSGDDFPYGVYIDGDTLPAHPMEAIKNGIASEIELIIGTNQDEYKLYSASLPDSNQVDEKRLLNMVRRILGIFGRDETDAAEMINTYKSARQGKLPTDPVNVRDAIMTDLRFRIPALRMAEAQAPHQANLFTYLFTYQTPVMGGKLGACHGLEIPFVFGTLGEKERAIYPKRDVDTDKLSEKMMAAWASYARSGDPSHGGIPTWGDYDLENRKTMLFGLDINLVDDPFGQERQTWDGLF